MIGSIKWNFIVGGIAFVATLAMSAGHNIWLTTLVRSFYSFIILFVLVFACRWLLGTFAGLDSALKSPPEEAEEEMAKGTAFDAITPPDQDAELHQMLKNRIDDAAPQAEEALFAPLNPPKLSTKISGAPDESSWEMAQALRRMTEE
ncbi:hypothetical protein SAMN02799630_01567 [Paenibacillus sp. UNCCL117]|uniref:hypothetical protein n=1 Tax=unclassified Paenibacillus TaxID=185978 RepID=UPI0008868BC2|nr:MULTISPECIES: hypothetical protein [unclassified Paenibacillus]SDC87000.1 hypothetical protein SAMN04488602_10452 [Paenibacillus sp. cl123]SFW27954.1 hypothetical protein SAMN02799630_01567 [Paenibacillus sp. UNCCL117]